MSTWTLQIEPPSLRLWKLAAEVTETSDRTGLQWIALSGCGVAMTSNAYLLPWWPWRDDAEDLPDEDDDRRVVPTPLIASTIRGLATKTSTLTVAVPEWNPDVATLDFDVTLTAPRAVSTWTSGPVEFTATVPTGGLDRYGDPKPPDRGKVPGGFAAIIRGTVDRLADEAASERVILSPKLSRQATHLAEAMHPPDPQPGVAMRYGDPMKPIMWTPDVGDLRGVVQMPMRSSS